MMATWHDDLLALLESDQTPLRMDDAATVRRAIYADAAAHGGRADSNRVRSLLAALPVTEQPHPRSVGPAYSGMLRRGEIERLRWIPSDDEAGRNAGKWTAAEYRVIA